MSVGLKYVPILAIFPKHYMNLCDMFDIPEETQESRYTKQVGFRT